MKDWVLYALISMFFAGFTSVIAKLGLTGITSELGLFIRTGFVFAFVFIFSIFSISKNEIVLVNRTNIWWLALSGITTAFSWIFYYKAIKLGEVSIVAIIDKGSFIVAVLLAWFILKEQLTPRIILGSLLILLGLIIVSQK